jgi:hypothetical protein
MYYFLITFVSFKVIKSRLFYLIKTGLIFLLNGLFLNMKQTKGVPFK